MTGRFTAPEKWDVDDEDYFRGDAIGSTSICRALGRDGPSDKTGDAGNAVHIAVLQPEAFHDRVVCPPPEVSPGSGTGQRKRMAEWREANAGKIILTPSEFDMVSAMRASIEGRELLRWLRQKGVEFEQSWRCTDQLTDLTIRQRPDAYLQSRRVAANLKSTKDASFSGFSAAVGRYAYHVDAALCTDIFGLDDFYWIVVGNKPPYRTALYRCPESWIEIGRRMYAAGLALLTTDRKPRVWWEREAFDLEDPPPWVEDEVKLHEHHAELVTERSIACE